MKRLVALLVIGLLFCGLASAATPDYGYNLKMLLHGNLEPTAFSTSDFRDSSRYFAMPYANPNTSGAVDVNSSTAARIKYGNASLFVKALNSNVTVPDSPEYTFGTNNHSISAWIYFPQAVSTVYLWQHIQDANNYDRLAILDGTATSIGYQRVRGGVAIGTQSSSTSSNIATGIWYHVAVIQNGTHAQLYLNGTPVGAGFARTGTQTDLNGPVNIGRGLGTGGLPTATLGYYHLDEVVVTNGGIAPTIAELTGEWPLYLNATPYGGYADDDYTVSLLHFNGTDNARVFTDQYANRSWSNTTLGVVTATNASKFGSAGAFFALDGRIVGTASSDYDMGTGCWTADVWVNRTPGKDSSLIYVYYPTSGSVGYGLFCTATTCTIRSNQSGSFVADASATVSFTDGVNSHLAFERSSLTELRIYQDGTLKSTTTIPDAYQYNTYNVAPMMRGYNVSFDEPRLSKGIARWTANFTPPTDPYELIEDVTFTATPDASGTAPVTVQFNVTDPSDAWTENTYNWSFGDGSYSALKEPSHVYSTTGLFNATLTAMNNNMTNLSRLNIPVGAPVPQFSATPLTGTAALQVRFTDMTTNTSPITAYLLEFGDGESTTDAPDATGGWNHVYASYGIFSPNLTATNTYGSGYEYKRDYIIVSTDQSTVLENFVPKEIQFSFVDSKNNRVLNAPVNASVIASSFPTGTDWLVSLYSVDPTAANQMLNGTLMMQGHTDSTGSIVFTMQPSLQYNISVIVPSTGVVQSSTLYPTASGSPYTIHILGTAVNNTYMDIGYNTTLYVYEPNASYATFELAYQDMSGRTTLLEYFLVDRNNATPLLINYQSTAAVGTNTVRMNYTLPNTRGQRFSWYYNAVRTL